MFEIAAKMRKDKMDIYGTTLIGGEIGVIEIKEQSVRKNMKRLFWRATEFWERKTYWGRAVDGGTYICNIMEEETLECMENGWAGGYSGVKFERLKLTGSSEIDELLIIFNQIISNCKFPEHWTENLTVAILKNK